MQLKRDGKCKCAASLFARPCKEREENDMAENLNSLCSVEVEQDLRVTHTGGEMKQGKTLALLGTLKIPRLRTPLCCITDRPLSIYQYSSQ